MINPKSPRGFVGSAFLTTTVGGTPDTIKSVLANPSSAIVALVTRANFWGMALGNANFCSVHLRRLAGVANGVGTSPGIPILSSGSRDSNPGSQCTIRRDNASDAGVVTAITATLLDVMGTGGLQGAGSTAAGMVPGTRVNLVPAHGAIALLPGEAIGMCGSQTGLYSVPSWEWWEIQREEFESFTPLEWYQWLASIRGE